MKTNSVPLALPIVTSGTPATPPVDIEAAFGGFAIQFVNVTAATAVQYAVEASLDGHTWVDVTNCLHDLGNGGTALSATITTDSIYEFVGAFPGSVHVVCKHAPTSPPGTPPTAILSYQDSRST